MLPLRLWGQQKENTPFPKDTIYISFQKTPDNKKILNWDYNEKTGIYFSIKDSSNTKSNKKKYISFFFPNEAQSDTLPKEALKHIQFSNLKEINQKRRSWIFDHNRPPLTKSKIFQTYVIEIISDTQIVRYPVIWRNEGVTP